MRFTVTTSIVSSITYSVEADSAQQAAYKILTGDDHSAELKADETEGLQEGSLIYVEWAEGHQAEFRWGSGWVAPA